MFSSLTTRELRNRPFALNFLPCVESSKQRANISIASKDLMHVLGFKHARHERSHSEKAVVVEAADRWEGKEKKETFVIIYLY